MSTELDQYIDNIIKHNNPLNTPGHEFVSNYLKEQRNLGNLKTTEDGQDALRTAWDLARKKGLVKNPRDEYFDFSGRSMEMRRDSVDEAEAAYRRTVNKYGENSAAAQNALGKLMAASSRLYGERNPRMDLQYYKNKPATTVVVVREYERRLPRRTTVESKEKEYKRLKPVIGDIVRGSHEKFGNEADEEEARRLGISKDKLFKPLGNRRAARKATKKNPSDTIMIVVGGIAALIGVSLFSRMRKV